jgi:hypothetical protein
VQLRVRRAAGLAGDLGAGSAGVVGECGDGKLPGGVDLLAGNGGPAHGHLLFELGQGHPHRRKVRLLQPGTLLGRHEGQQGGDGFGWAEVAVDAGHVEPAAHLRFAGRRVQFGGGDVGGLHQSPAGGGVAAGGQPFEAVAVQGGDAQALEQAAVQFDVAVGGGAVGGEVVVGLLLAAVQVAEQVAADGGDRRRAELPWREHATRSPEPLQLQHPKATPTPLHRPHSQPSDHDHDAHDRTAAEPRQEQTRYAAWLRQASGKGSDASAATGELARFARGSR